MFHQPCKTTLKGGGATCRNGAAVSFNGFSFHFQKNGESKRPTGNSLGLQQSKR
jgi:hypothetical protein